jgi:hypothetical protein
LTEESLRIKRDIEDAIVGRVERIGGVAKTTVAVNVA